MFRSLIPIARRVGTLRTNTPKGAGRAHTAISPPGPSVDEIHYRPLRNRHWVRSQQAASVTLAKGGIVRERRSEVEEKHPNG